MIVVCEGCQKRFQLDDARIPKQGARVRCKHCKHRFRVPPPGDAPTEATPPSAEASGKYGDSIFGQPVDASTTAPAAATAAPDPNEDSIFGSSFDGGATATPDPATTPDAAKPGSDSDQELRFVTDPLGDDADADAGADTPAAAVTEAEAEGAAAGETTLAPEPAHGPDLAAAAAAVAEAPAEAEAESASEPESEPEPEVAAPEGNGEAVPESGTWEFADTDLSLDAEEAVPPDAAARAPVPPAEPPAEEPAEAAASAEPAEPSVASLPGFEPDRPEVAEGEPTVDETPSLRAVGPGAGGDSAFFEAAAGEAGAPLELEDESVAAPPETGEPPGESAEAAASLGSAPPADPAPAGAPPEIGSAADWDVLAGDAAPETPAFPSEAVPDEVASFDDLEEEDPDWPVETDDLPVVPVPPPAASRTRVWLEHAGWTLSLLLFVLVTTDAVRIRPLPVEVPPGRVEVAGLSAENVRGRFVDNARSGTLFVVSGELRNRGGAPRQPSALRVVLLDEHGAALEGNAAPIGAELSEAMVRETPVGALAQQQELLAAVLAQRSLAPGEGVPFHAILSEMPERAVRFRIEPAPDAPRAPSLPSAEEAEAPAGVAVETDPPG